MALGKAFDVLVGRRGLRESVVEKKRERALELKNSLMS